MAAQKKYKVTLTAEERETLTAIIKRGESKAYKVRHAQILLNADSEGDNRSDEEICQIIKCHKNTVANVRQRFVEQGFEVALERKKREIPPHEPKLDGDGEAHLLAIACSNPPAGRSSWTLQMLSDRLVEMKVVESICPETVRRTLKKTRSNPICGNAG